MKISLGGYLNGTSGVGSRILHNDKREDNGVSSSESKLSSVDEIFSVALVADVASII